MGVGDEPGMMKSEAMTEFERGLEPLIAEEGEGMSMGGVVEREMEEESGVSVVVFVVSVVGDDF